MFSSTVRQQTHLSLVHITRDRPSRICPRALARAWEASHWTTTSRSTAGRTAPATLYPVASARWAGFGSLPSVGKLQQAATGWLALPRFLFLTALCILQFPEIPRCPMAALHLARQPRAGFFAPFVTTHLGFGRDEASLRRPYTTHLQLKSARADYAPHTTHHMLRLLP